MQKSKGPERAKTALVCGGSVAGLLASRVLSDHFAQVIILERDDPPGDFSPRKGAPQGRHLHVLLLRGKEIMESMFPGFVQEAKDAGGIELEQGSEILLFTKFGEWSPREANGNYSLNTSRPMLEELLRRRVLALPNVTMHTKVEVTGLLWNDAHTKVEGVTSRKRGKHTEEADGSEPDAQAEETRWEADLVVEASGNHSKLPTWLAATGRPPLEESMVNSFAGYASRIYEMPEDFDGDWKWMIMWNNPPHIPRAGHIYQIEGRRWLVSLMGMAKQYPPTEEEGFLDFAKSLSHPLLYETIRDAKPLGPIYGYRDTKNIFRHYEKLTPWPKRLAVLGDATCRFNPTYGQGMTVSAHAASLLGDCLADKELSLDDLGPHFQKALGKQNQLPWTMATGEEVRWPETEGAKATLWTRIQHAYIDKVAWLVPRSRFINDRYAGVINLTGSIASLFHPFIILAVLFWPRKAPPSDAASLPPPRYIPKEE